MASNVGSDLQAMRDQVAELERLANADKEDFDAINRSMQKAIVATQNASLGMHQLNNSNTHSARGAALRGSGEYARSNSSGSSNTPRGGLGSRQNSGTGGDMAPRPPPRQYSGSGGTSTITPISGRPAYGGGGVSKAPVNGLGSRNASLSSSCGGGGAGMSRESSGAPPDPVLIDSLVAALVGQGVSHDLALAAVQGSGGTSLEAAKRWIATSGSAGGGGRGALRAVRQMRALDSHSLAEVASAPQPPPRSVVPLTAGGGGASGAGVGISPIRGSRNPCNLPNIHSPEKSLTSTTPPPNSLLPADSASSSGRVLGRENSGPVVAGLGSRQTSLRESSAAGDSKYTWSVPSPMKGDGGGAEAGSIQIQVRCQGGKLIALSRRFHPTDSLRSVMHELLRQHGSEVIPKEMKGVTEQAVQDCCSFSVPFPRARYTWPQLDSTTVQTAVGPRGGTLIFSTE